MVVMAALHSAQQVGFVSQPLLLVELLFAHGEAKLSAAVPALESLILLFLGGLLLVDLHLLLLLLLLLLVLLLLGLILLLARFCLGLLFLLLVVVLVVRVLCLALLARLLLLVLLFGLLGLDLLGLLLLCRRERVSVCNSPHFSLPNH